MASPAFAPPDVKDVTLSLFAGAKTDIAPSDLPEGLTPDTQDGIYLPGEWAGRPGLSRLFAVDTLPAGTSILYEKTYVQPNDDPLTLLLTSEGVLYAEDVGNNPGAPTQIGNVPPALYAQSVTAFGREYIAVSDLLHGQGVPLQYDGTNLDRVTQDGPGSPVTAADLNSSSAIGGGSGLVAVAGITSITEALGIATVTTGGAHGLAPGQVISIFGNTVSGYNGLQTVGTVPSPTTFTFATSTTGTGTGGNVGDNTALINTLTPHNLNDGDACSISGTNDSGKTLDNNVQGNPAFWTVAAVLTAGSVLISLVGAGSALFADSTANFGSGTLQTGGQSSPGVHQVVVMFLTRNGYITKPSPASSFTSAGNSQWVINELPIGPANVVARILGFTGTGGDNFFIIPANSTLPNITLGALGPITVQATLVPDNISTSVTLDVADNSLLAAVPIDQIGNDLFDQVVLGPVLGFFAYASRLVAWGDYQKIENLLNMGFCGGVENLLAPDGWAVVTTGGRLQSSIASAPWADGFSWEITGDGSSNPKGQISQTAYLDSFGDPILTGSTNYVLRLWAISTTQSYGGGGNVIVDFYSPTAGVLASASIPCNSMPVALPGQFFQANFTAETPSTIPSDTVLRVYALGLPNHARAFVSEVEIVYAEDPYRDNLSRWSYTLNPEAFALTTGNLGASDDDSPIRCFTLLRQSAVLGTGEGIHIFEDNTNEPGQWNVNSLTRSVGAISLRAFDCGKFGTGDGAEDWLVVASKNGGYLFAGGDFWKISQEISRGSLPQSQDPRKTWDDINWAVQQTIVTKNDPAKRRAYFAVPINGAITPNFVFVMDYREMDTATQIAGAPPLHITIQGKMKSSDLTRKWSGWNVAANDIDILIRPSNVQKLFFAGGNGQAIGSGPAYGNVYSLDPAKLTDDDYGQFFPYYTTYAFTDHDQEQALGIGSDLHLVKRIHAFVAGVGQVIITPIVDSLYNFFPSFSPRLLVADTDQSNFLRSDLEWTAVGLRGQRIFFRISVIPLPGATDVQIRLQKFVVGMMKDPVAQTRQSVV